MYCNMKKVILFLTILTILCGISFAKELTEAQFIKNFKAKYVFTAKLISVESNAEDQFLCRFDNSKVALVTCFRQLVLQEGARYKVYEYGSSISRHLRLYEVKHQ